jgi:vacuolar-type H+-ATPase subunit E/Vma4
MSLERLIDEVQARNQAALVEEQHRQDAEKAKLLADRDQRIEKIRGDAARQSAADTARERIQRLASAKLEARKRLFEAQEARARAEIEEVRALLASFTSTPPYAEVLHGMYDFAVQELGRAVSVSGRTEDAETLRNLAGKGFDPTPLPILGGLVASTPDGHRRLDLSLDELLRLREGEVRELLRG